MKFTTAWAEIASQNVTLKFTVGALSICCIVLAFTLIKLALKDPLILDRGCATLVSSLSDAKHTDQEIRSFVGLALQERYDSMGAVSHYLSDAELAKREQEQKNLSEKKIVQRIFVNSVIIEKDLILVQADKLLSVGNIRSAFMFPIKAQIKRTDRGEANPYGLILNDVTPVKVENVETK